MTHPCSLIHTLFRPILLSIAMVVCPNGQDIGKLQENAILQSRLFLLRLFHCRRHLTSLFFVLYIYILGYLYRYVTVYPDAKVPEPVTVRDITLAPGITPHDSPEPFVNLEAFCSDDDSEAETLFV